MSAARLTMALSGAAIVAALNIVFGAGSAIATIAVVSVVAALIVSIPLRRWTGGLLIAIVFGIGCGVGAHYLGIDGLIAETLPAIAQTVLAVLVGRTLLPGKTPAIQRVAEALHEDGSPLPPNIARYTRRVTWLWTLTFTMLALSNLLILQPVVAHRPSSALVSAADLCIIGGMILGEFLYRRQRYAAFTVRNFGEFVRRLRHINFGLVLLG